MERLSYLDTQITENEVRHILGLCKTRYREAHESGALPITGNLRPFPTPRENFHTLWDVLHFRVHQATSGTARSVTLNAEIAEFLDDISRLIDSGLRAEDVLGRSEPFKDARCLSDVVWHWFAEVLAHRFDVQLIGTALRQAYIDCLGALGLSEELASRTGRHAHAA